MVEARIRPVGHSMAMKATSLACILLVALGLSFQAAHLHLDAKFAPAKHCSVCLSPQVALASAGAHAPASGAATPASRVAIVAAAYIPFHSFSLYNRPPPPQA